MTRLDCPREAEVVRAVVTGGWPHGVDGDLHLHVEACEVCRDVAAVAGLLHESHAAAPEAHVPAAGQVWWRAVVRARLEAAQTAARPVTWLQGMTAAAVAGALIALVGMLWPTVRATAARLEDHAAALVPDGEVATLMGLLSQQHLVLLIAGAACLLLAPIALYLALSDD